MKKLLFSVFSFALLCFSSQSFSQGNRIFMSVPGSQGFDGGVTVVGYEKSIEVFSYSDGLQACAGQATAGTSSNRSGCKPTSTGFAFMIKLSPAVTGFQKALLEGKLLKVNVSQVKNVGGTYNAIYEIQMENVMVTSLQVGASGETPYFSITLQPEKIKWTVKTQNADGSQGANSEIGWDFSKNIPY